MWVWILSAVLIAGLAFFLRWFFGPIITSWVDPSPLSYSYAVIQPNNNNTSDTSAASSSSSSSALLPYPQSLLFTDSVWSSQPSNRVYLSCIVPCYNEFARLQPMVTESMTYLLERSSRDPKFTFEMIFVDDGSKDQTAKLVESFITQYGIERVRLIKLALNQGKGGAVQQGMLHSRGEYLLMVDADGASRFSDVAKLESELKRVETNGHGIAVGSRRHLQQDAVARRAWHRNLMMHVFHFLVELLTGISHIKDTQCGFKLFTRATSQYLFVNQHIRRWCFDVELLYLAMHSHKSTPIPVVEVPITWEEIDGSKVDLFESSFAMTRDMALIRIAYAVGIWKKVEWKEIEETKLHQKNGEVNEAITGEAANKVTQGGKKKSSQKKK